MTLNTKLLGGVAALALMTSASALAQNQQQAQGAGALEEIVVTAQRRSESLQSVPIAVSAFTSAELEKRQVTKTLDLVNFVPNMMGSNNTSLGTANTYSLRSLASGESIPTTDPPVGTYVDDVFIARQNANNFSFFDVERVEILRGPQGTLFGRNTTGGAIAVYMRKPSEEFGGYVNVAYGRFNRLEVNGTVDVPINDKILTKFSAYFNDDKGYVKNLFTGERLNDERSEGYRAAIRANISDDIRWDTSFEYIDTALGNIINVYDPATGDRISRSGLLKGKRGTQFVNFLTGDKANYGLHNNAKVFSATSNFQISSGDAFNLEVITGYRGTLHEFLTDRLPFVAGPGGTQLSFRTGGIVNGTDGNYDQFTQELKSNGEVMDGKLKYVAGFFYLYEDGITDFADNNGTNAAGLLTVSADRTLRNKVETAAGYVQFDYLATDQLTLTAGIRYTDEKKEVDFQTNVAGPRIIPGVANIVPCTAPAGQPLFNPATGAATNPATCNIFSTRDLVLAGVPTTAKVNVWTPRLAIHYQYSEDMMLFASATRGFKSGGWNSRGTNGGAVGPFGPEYVWSYETGFRSDWADNTFRLNGTAYYMEVTDLQGAAASFNPITAQQIFITGNFSGLENYGVEIESVWVPTDGLNLNFSVGTQHARFTNLAPSIVAQQARCVAALAAGGTGPGNCNVAIVAPNGTIAIPTRAPKYIFSIGGNYAIPLGGDLELVPSINARRSASLWISGSNQGRNQANGFQPGYWRVNSGISLENDEAGWSIMAECENCFGETVITNFIQPFAFLDEPSKWAIRAKYKF